MPEVFAEPDDMSFWENMGENPSEEPAAEAQPDEAQEPSQDRPRGPDGKFVAKTEPEAEPGAEPLVALRDEGLEPDAAADDGPTKLAAYEKRIADQEQFIQRQANEVGELRKLVEQGFQQVQEQVARPLDFAALVEDDPAEAAEVAYGRGDKAALDYAIQAWQATEGRGPVRLWVENKRLAERLAQIEQQTAAYSQGEENRQFATGLNQVRQQYPDFFENPAEAVGNIPQEVADLLYSVIENGTAEQRVKALHTLAFVSGGRANPDTLQETAKNIAREQAIAADQAIREATVASAAAAKQEQPVSAADKIGAEWDALEAPYKDGWNIS